MEQKEKEKIDNAPISVKPAGGGKGGGGGLRAWGGEIRHFSKICRQIPCPRANHSSQLPESIA